MTTLYPYKTEYDLIYALDGSKAQLIIARTEYERKRQQSCNTVIQTGTVYELNLRIDTLMLMTTQEFADFADRIIEGSDTDGTLSSGYPDSAQYKLYHVCRSTTEEQCPPRESKLGWKHADTVRDPDIEILDDRKKAVRSVSLLCQIIEPGRYSLLGKETDAVKDAIALLMSAYIRGDDIEEVD